MKDILGLTCDMGPSCKMYKTLAIQTYITLAIAGFIFVIGLFLVFSKEHEKIIIRTVKDKRKCSWMDAFDCHHPHEEILCSEHEGSCEGKDEPHSDHCSML